MYHVIFYEDKNGKSEVLDFIRGLNRILYAYYENDTFIILHHFMKKTRKTPRREIERAINNLADYRERNGE